MIERHAKTPGEEFPELDCGICHAKVPTSKPVPKDWIAAIQNDLDWDRVTFRFVLCPSCLPVVETFIEKMGRS